MYSSRSSYFVKEFLLSTPVNSPRDSIEKNPVLFQEFLQILSVNSSCEDPPWINPEFQNVFLRRFSMNTSENLPGNRPENSVDFLQDFFLEFLSISSRNSCRFPLELLQGFLWSSYKSILQRFFKSSSEVPARFPKEFLLKFLLGLLLQEFYTSCSRNSSKFSIGRKKLKKSKV